MVVGHKSTSPGAVNPPRGLSEFEFNARLALDVWRRLRVSSSLEPVLVFRRTYESLPQDINAVNPLLVVFMHCNAFDRKASGTEVLYYHRSRTGKKLAEVFQRHFLSKLGLADRGARPVNREDRGGWALAETEAPAVLCEPFFLDNEADLDLVVKSDLATVYAEAINEGMKLV